VARLQSHSALGQDVREPRMPHTLRTVSEPPLLRCVSSSRNTCEAPDTAGTGTAAGALVVRLSRLRARLPRRSHHWSRWAGSVHRQGILGEGAKTPGRPRRSEPSKAWSTASAAIRNCVLSDRGGGWSTRLAPVGARDARLAKSSRAGRRQPGRTAAPPVRTARWSSAHPSGQGVAGLSSRPHRGRLVSCPID